MLCIANLQPNNTNNIYRGEPEHEVPIPQGNSHAKQSEQLLPIRLEEWLEGPDGLMSLGEMPIAA
eukprot:7561056-Karenia_brevis.AAC.1